MHAIALLMLLLAASPGDDKELEARCNAAAQTRDDGRDGNVYGRCLESKGKSLLPAPPPVVTPPTPAEILADAQVERDLAPARAAQAESDRRYQEQLDKAQTAEDAANEAMQKKCGKDYHRIRVGMSFARVKQCAGVELWVKYADATKKVYEGDGGLVRVEHGRVVSVMFE